ncbi:hypothetical protein ALC56_01328, partial [Trachymyrmex septentrionalis]
DIVHSYSYIDVVFKEHFKLLQHTAYSQIDVLNIMMYLYSLKICVPLKYMFIFIFADMLEQSGFISSHSFGMPKILAEWSFIIYSNLDEEIKWPEGNNSLNLILCSIRIKIEKTFGYLKGRFRRLKFLELLDIEFIPKLITAACILHNTAIKENDENEFFFDDININNDANYEIINLHINRNRNVIDRRMQMFRELFRE